MMTKTRAVVLRQLKYGDQSLIVDMLTRELGRVSFAVRVPKTSRGKLRKQLFQPMTLLDVELDYRERSQLQRLREARIAAPYNNMHTDPVKLAETLFLAELLHYVTRDEQQNHPLFAFVENSMQWLDMAVEGYANFHLVFLMRLTRFVGFFPNLDDYADGCCFDLREARFTTATPVHPDFLQPTEAARIATLMRMDFTTMRLFRMSRADRNRIAEVLVRYYRLHVPQMPEPLSLPVLQELFA